MAKSGWTDERRAKQSQLIKNWKPWEKSTGPRTEAGKKVSSVNACKWNFREILREIKKSNREIVRYMQDHGTAPANNHDKMNALLNDFGKSMERERTEQMQIHELPQPD